MKGLGESSPFHLFTNPRPDKSVYFWSWGTYLLCMFYFIFKMHMLETTVEISACSKQCSPFWLSAIDLAIGQLPGNHPICRTGNYTSCSQAESVCTMEPTKIVCCPMECLGPIKSCYKGPETQNLCIPIDVTRMYFDKLVKIRNFLT